MSSSPSSSVSSSDAGIQKQPANRWKKAASDVRWNIQPFIDGRYCPSAAVELVDDINPATETVLCRFPAGDPADIDKAVRVARERFDEGCWSGMSPSHRAEILRRLADAIVEHAAELALLDCLEMGKPIRAALHDAQSFAPNILRSWAGFAESLWGVSAPMSSAALSFNVYEPRGVVGAISPWNFPASNAVYKFGPALAAGNTIVLKPSEISPSSALRLAELAVKAGVPEGVLNVVPGLGTTVGEALTVHPDVDMISFTGSTATGQRIMQLAGRLSAKPLLLECGGKSPQVVFDDVEDLDVVADAVVESFLRNQGQVCSAHTRLLVHQGIKEALLERVVARARECRPGDPLDESTTFGPLASSGQRDRVVDYIDGAILAGADPVLQIDLRSETGCYVGPTIFDGVDEGMAIVQEEVFGPVLCVQTFKDERDAVTLANGTKFALAATVWTRDMGRGRRLAHAINAGYVFVRSSGEEAVGASELLSFEPRKDSGFGSEIGRRGLESYSTLKGIAFTGA